MQRQDGRIPLQQRVDALRRLSKALLTHQTVRVQHSLRSQHDVVQPAIRQREPFLRHLPQGYALGLPGIHAQLHPERPQRRRVLAQVPGVGPVVGYALHSQRDAVGQRSAKANDTEHFKQHPCAPDVPARRDQRARQRRRKQVRQHAAQIVEFVGHFPLCQLRRGQQALSGRARQRVAVEAQASVFPLHHPAADAEGDEPVARQQATHQVPALVQDGLQVERRRHHYDEPGDMQQVLPEGNTLHDLEQIFARKNAQRRAEQHHAQRAEHGAVILLCLLLPLHFVFLFVLFYLFIAKFWFFQSCLSSV